MMQQDQYQATVYPDDATNPTVANADASRKKIAVCLSGGGSRALTCAWGQLIGLNSLDGGHNKTLLDQVRYISSVSGGSWAAVLYTFRPAQFSDAEFLGPAYLPSQLYYAQNLPACLNVGTMGKNALGKVPQKFKNVFESKKTQNIIAEFIALTVIKKIPLNESAKWLWMYVVGKDVLADFKLYKYSKLSPIGTPWQYKSADFFSLTKTYAQQTIYTKQKAPPTDGFVYVRTDAAGNPAVPMLIINTNVIGNNIPGKKMSSPVQIPAQVSPVAAGIYGRNPGIGGDAGDNIGGGGVDSFAFTSRLTSASGLQVTGEFDRRYSLADITACSSAFFAATLADPMMAAISWLQGLSDDELHQYLAGFAEIVSAIDLKAIRANLAKYAAITGDLHAADFVPQYNYWPVDALPLGTAANQNTQFSDGGSMDNTGVAGLLAQVQGDADKIIAFVNGATVLEERNGQIIAATQMAPLFGVAYNAHTGQFARYQQGGVNPFTGDVDPIGFLQIFDNTHGQFDALRHGLYNANGAGAKFGPAFFQQKLTLLKNSLLGIKVTDTITILWVQNAEVNQWQQQIIDPVLQQKIQAGQAQGGQSEFANFPYYSTFLKLYQTAAETNTLAQMHAWCVSDAASPLRKAIVEFFA
jgi:hypothetical protein